MRRFVSNSDSNLFVGIENQQTEQSSFLVFPFILLSILTPLGLFVETGVGAAQGVVRVRSETRIELFVNKASQPARLTGTLHDSLGIPLPNQRVEIGATTTTDRKARAVVTTGSNGAFALPVAAISRGYGFWARFAGNTFYEATETTLDTDENDSSTRIQSSRPKDAVSARKSYLGERQKENSESPSVLWLLIPMFLCLAVVVAIKRRVSNQRSKFEPPNELPMSPGVKVSLPVRHARRDQTSISGTIRDLHNGDAVPQVQLTLVHELGSSITLDITSEGFFSSPRLNPGEWRIQARANGYVETTKELFIPHRGEWTNVRIHMLSMRTLALQSYRKVALALLPTPQLWDIWTARETLLNSRKVLGSLALFRSLVESVERSSYRRTPPSCEEVKIIETQASSAIRDISRGETDYTVTRRR